MRHGKKVNHLSRTAAHRGALLSNMASSLILHKRINTTLAKAKALRKYVEPILTKAKEDTTHSRRTVFSYLQNKESVQELFGAVAQKIADRPGGYTRIIRTGIRQGDNSEMCMMELVDFNELLLNESSAKAKTTRRSRRGASKKADAPAVEAKANEVVTDAEIIEETPKASEEPAADSAADEEPKKES